MKSDSDTTASGSDGPEQLTETEISEIAEVLSVFYTNRAALMDTFENAPGEQEFTVYANPDAAHGSMFDYYVQVHEVYVYPDRGRVEQDTLRHIGTDAYGNWRISPSGNDMDSLPAHQRELETLGADKFTIDETEHAIFEDYSEKEKDLLTLWRRAVEASCISSDLLEGKHEIRLYLENFTQYDYVHGVYQALDGRDSVEVIEIVWSEEPGEGAYRVNVVGESHRSPEELEESAYLNTLGTVNNTWLAEVSEEEQRWLVTLCGSVLGYMQEQHWQETGEVDGTLKGSLYVVDYRAEIRDIYGELWFCPEEGEPLKLEVMLPDGRMVDSIRDCSGAAYTIDRNAEFAESVKEEAVMKMEFDLNTWLNE